MPRTLFDGDGNEIEVPNEEELTELKTKAEGSEEATAKVTELESTITELEKDVNPDWKGLRTKAKNLEKALKDAEVNYDPLTGEVIKEAAPLSDEDLDKKIDAGVQKKLVTAHKKTLLSGYDDEQKQVIEKYLDAFIDVEGVEILTADDLNPVFEKALGAAGIKTSAKPHIKGQAPRVNTDGKSNYAETEEGQAMGKELFDEDYISPTNSK